MTRTICHFLNGAFKHQSKSYALFRTITSFFIAFSIIFSFSSSVLAQDQTNDQKIEFDYLNQPLDSTLSWMQQNVYEDSNGFHLIALHALSQAYATENVSLIGDAHTQLANWHGYNGFFPEDSVVFHSEKSLQYYLLAGDKAKIAKAYKVLSIDYININENEKAQEALFKALGMFEELGDEQGIAGAYRNLSDLYTVMEEPEKSIVYADKAIELFKKANDYASISITYFNYIRCYKMLKQYDKAYQAADDCIEMVRTKATDEIYVPMRAYSFRGDVSIETKDFDQALKDYTKSWENCVGLVGEDRCLTYRTEIGNAFRLQGKHELALEHLLAGIGAFENKDNNRIWLPYSNISDCYQALGDYKNALIYQQKSTAIRYKLLEDKVGNLETETVIKYETGKKDQEILAQETQLAQQSKIQKLMFGIAGLLVALLFALFYNYQKNQKINRELKVKNAENELLLKEIHHRVKNNLQTISSLLSLQSESIQDKAALDAVQESKNRVASMALLHQKLYQGENLAAIEMRDYFETIGRTILDSFGKKAENVSLKIDMSEMELDVDTAVPIGLITNELITNSIKHAFHNQKQGQISIALMAEENDTLKLCIADNGQTNIIKNEKNKVGGFGTLLVQLLTTQLGGQLEKTSEDGTATIIRFSLQEKSVA